MSNERDKQITSLLFWQIAQAVVFVACSAAYYYCSRIFNTKSNYVIAVAFYVAGCTTVIEVTSFLRRREAVRMQREIDRRINELQARRTHLNSSSNDEQV